MWLASVASGLCWTCRFELSDRGMATLCIGCKVSIFRSWWLATLSWVVSSCLLERISFWSIMWMLQRGYTRDYRSSWDIVPWPVATNHTK
jgi:hypothetical protein